MRQGLSAVVLALALAAPAWAGQGFEWKEIEGGRLELTLDSKPVLRHMHAFDTSTPERAHETYKVYTHVIDPATGEPITKGAGGRYTHHRGLFIGFSKLEYDGGKKGDWWHMKGVHMVHRKFLEKTADADSASFTELIHWVDGEGEPVVIEERTITVHRRPEPVLALVDFSSKLKASRSDVVLAGDPEHAGMQYRAANEVNENKSAQYAFPAEDTEVKKDRDLPWAGLEYRLGDRTYHVQHMNHPENPKGTLYSAYRPYGRFGAYAKTEVKQGESVTMRYRLRIARGPMPQRETMQEKYETYAKGE